MAKTRLVQVPKVWGRELIIDNNELYCGKILVVDPGFQSSLHYHEKKTETFYVAYGMLDLEHNGVKHTLVGGDIVKILPGEPHRFSTPHGSSATIYEFSTPHSDDDVVRLDPSRALAKTG